MNSWNLTYLNSDEVDAFQDLLKNLEPRMDIAVYQSNIIKERIAFSPKSLQTLNLSPFNYNTIEIPKPTDLASNWKLVYGSDMA